MKLLVIMLAMALTIVGALHSWHNRNLYLEAALLSEAFNITSPVKLRVADHYVAHGAMPHDNADAGLGRPETLFGTSVRRVAINRSGVIRVDFDEEIGARAMTFTPTVSTVSGLLSWNCTSDSIAENVLGKLKPGCSYLPSTVESQLMNAIANRDLAKVDSLLAAGAKVEAIVYGNTPLMLAAKNGYLEIVEHLLDAGAHVDNAALGTERRTPLMVAISSNQPEVVGLLLSRSASIHRKDYRGMTALDHAVETDRRLGGERYTLMVSARFNPLFATRQSDEAEEQSIDIVERTRQLQTLYDEYRQAARDCHVQRIASLLRSESDLESPEMVAGEPLSVHFRKPECVATLQQHLAGKDSYAQALSARMADASQRCDVGQVEALLRDNPEFDVTEVYIKQSHFDRAVLGGCAGVVRLMVRDQGLIDRLDDDVLVNAILNSPQGTLVKMVSNLIGAGANVNGQDVAGRTPLGAAISAQQPVVAKYLVDAGANVNAPTANNSYPLVEATKQGFQHLVLHLIANGANIDVRDSLGRSAVLVAVANDRLRLVDELVRAGANTRLSDHNGINPLMLAESRESRRIRQVLLAEN